MLRKKAVLLCVLAVSHACYAAEGNIYIVDVQDGIRNIQLITAIGDPVGEPLSVREFRRLFTDFETPDGTEKGLLIHDSDMASPLVKISVEGHADFVYVWRNYFKFWPDYRPPCPEPPEPQAESADVAGTILFGECLMPGEGK